VNTRRIGRIGIAVTIVLFGVGIGLLGQGEEWSELRTGYGFRIHPRTFVTEAVFHVALRYERAVVCPDIEVTWAILDVTGGGETLIDDLYSHYPDKYCRAPSIASFEVLSPFFEPEPGRSYQAWVTINDLKFGLSYETTLSYTASASLPSALPLNVETIEAEIVYLLDRWSDEQIEELLLWSNRLETDTVQTASEVLLEDFFNDWVQAESMFPAEVWTVAKVADEVDFASQRPGVTFSPTYTRILFSFFVPDSRSIASVLDELRAFSPELEILGEVRTPSDPSDMGDEDPRIYFIGSNIPDVVDAAQGVFDSE